jgi:hypothetical protein
MTQTFKKHIANFLMLHLVFAIILLTGYKLFTDFTMETFSYIIWFIIIFGLLTSLIQSVIFSFISSKMRLNKFPFFIIAFTIELVLANAFVLYANGGGDSLTGNLINDIKYHYSWENLSGTLIFHVAIFLATLVISLTRPVYKQSSI